MCDVTSGEQLPEGSAALLGAVLELAVMVARAGLRAVPPVDPPAGLKPFMRFTRRAPAPALRAARRVLDTDDDFRARVASIATEELVGDVGVLFAARPEGWMDRVRSLVEGAEGDEERLQGGDRKLERRLAGAESAAQRAEESLARLRAELVASQTALREERRQRTSAGSEVLRLRALVDAHAAEVRTLRSDAVGLASRLSGVDADREDLRRQVAFVSEELSRRLGLDAAVRDAVGAVDRLSGMLHVLVDRARLDTPTLPSTVPSKSIRKRGEVGPARRPATLPPAILEDSPEAAAHLLRVSGALVLVDGYNVAKRKWPDAFPSELRERLLGVVGAMALRSAATVHLVFDGSAGSTHQRRTGAARVHVTFSPAGVEADDVVIEMASAAPVRQPVVVVSDDRRVQDGVRSFGANIVPVSAFLAACGAALR